MKNSGKKITFEQYLQFYQFSWLSNISRFSLNHIIEMHGFVKLHLERKSCLQECLESIDLMEPARSTLEDSISSCASLSSEEIVKDLEEIGWREGLLVRSIKTLESDAEREFTVAGEDLPFAKSARVRRCRRRRIPPAEFVIAGKRPRSRRKRVSVNALMNATAAAAAAAVVGSSVSSSSSMDVDDGDEIFVPSPPPLPVEPRPETPPPPSSPPPPLDSLCLGRS